jgi:hypothetical protein
MSAVIEIVQALGGFEARTAQMQAGVSQPKQLTAGEEN